MHGDMHHSDLELFMRICRDNRNQTEGMSTMNRIIQTSRNRAKAYDPMLRWAATEWALRLLLSIHKKTPLHSIIPNFCSELLLCIVVARKHVLTEATDEELKITQDNATGLKTPEPTQWMMLPLRDPETPFPRTPSRLDSLSRATTLSMERRKLQNVVRVLCLNCADTDIQESLANMHRCFVKIDVPITEQPHLWYSWFYRRLGWLAGNALIAGHRTWFMVDEGIPPTAQPKLASLDTNVIQKIQDIMKPLTEEDEQSGETPTTTGE